MKMKTIAAVCLVAMSVTWLTGCSGRSINKYSVPSKKEVMKYVDELCPSEDVDYEVSEGKGKYYGEKQVIYEFSSNERDMEFEVIATCQCDSYFTFVWSKTIEETYRNNIRMYYKDEIEDVFEKYDDSLDTARYVDSSTLEDPEYDYALASHLIVEIDSYEDMVDLVDFCHELNEIYAQEKEFNSKDWMEENPLFWLEIRFDLSDNTRKYNKFSIDGNDDYDDTYDDLMDMYEEVYGAD